MPRRRPESRRCPAAGGSAVGLAGVAPHSLLPPCVCVCKRLPLLLAAAASRPTFSPPRSVSGEVRVGCFYTALPPSPAPLLFLRPLCSSCSSLACPPQPCSPPPRADLLLSVPCFARTSLPTHGCTLHPDWDLCKAGMDLPWRDTSLSVGLCVPSGTPVRV
ncbi:uncharacterized protein LOC128805495 isoform X3 [Vidua macroura]|uniref:uncharacterized protein LOC128805495 isoform X3 n=1 Tax=Vidua macroura TaxID=187451 RepID=UPI0023A7BBB6|nr:uncharacterized protein LOC128805495 isoform X3 [Vidua macroura]